MRKARITAHQIIAVIRSVESDRLLKMSTGRPVFLKPPGTTGSLDTAAGIRVESQKAPPYLLSAQAEFSP
ncbi:hypothetical protein D5552_21900 [Salmonella enterica]|nr:hypothetical protein [Salmonella enterica]